MTSVNKQKENRYRLLFYFFSNLPPVLRLPSKPAITQLKESMLFPKKPRLMAESGNHAFD